jgi:hypothetical protein
MNKQDKIMFQRLANELALERQVVDQLVDALINGGTERQFAALTFHEHTRNGFLYHGIKVGNSPEFKPMKQAKRGKRSPNHPNIHYKYNKPIINPDFWIDFDKTQNNNPEEDNQ